MSFDSILAHGKEINPDLGIAIEAALAAGEVIKAGQGQIHDVESKGVGDLVSEVDKNADIAIAEVLNKHSDLAILSEESSPTIAEGVEEFWIVDPLDATSAFLTQAGPQYPSVLINRQQGETTTSSVVYFPLTDEWFYAAKGRGAWKDAKRLVVGDEPMTLLESWVEMNQYADNSLETELFASMRQRLRSKYGAPFGYDQPASLGRRGSYRRIKVIALGCDSRQRARARQTGGVGHCRATFGVTGSRRRVSELCRQGVEPLHSRTIHCRANRVAGPRSD